MIDEGLIHEDGSYFPITVGVQDGETGVGYPAGLNRPTYTWLASLPTDPDALLRRLSTEITRDQDERDTPATASPACSCGDSLVPAARTAYGAFAD
ncbi:hypothetical protein [Streptomyces sp. NPDC048436]|uniref:hypothetical protein n=1 Tax=Streptomyces sp. NPDC048436 TaxID=3365550 RepID=UPI00371A43E8